jgi:hypothetical protein
MGNAQTSEILADVRPDMREQVFQYINLVRELDVLPLDVYLYGISYREKRQQLRDIERRISPYMHDVYSSVDEIADDFGFSAN